MLDCCLDFVCPADMLNIHRKRQAVFDFERMNDPITDSFKFIEKFDNLYLEFEIAHLALFAGYVLSAEFYLADSLSSFIGHRLTGKDG